MNQNGTAPAAPEAAELTLEQKVDALIWLHVEAHDQVIRLAMAVSSLLAQAAQPQMQQGILSQLLG
jgi:hypothetical protein